MEEEEPARASREEVGTMRSCRLAACTRSGLFCRGCLHLFLRVTPDRVQMCKALAICRIFSQNRAGKTKSFTSACAVLVRSLRKENPAEMYLSVRGRFRARFPGPLPGWWFFSFQRCPVSRRQGVGGEGDLPPAPPLPYSTPAHLKFLSC